LPEDTKEDGRETDIAKRSARRASVECCWAEYQVDAGREVKVRSLAAEMSLSLRTIDLELVLDDAGRPDTTPQHVLLIWNISLLANLTHKSNSP
jgi:hypothetical protein